jgi:hypothetical protein
MIPGIGLAQPLNLGIIANQRSYWSTHFYSVLECLRYHNTLQWPGRKLSDIGKVNWSLEDLRGVAPPNFFQLIDANMRNWGMQYFLATFLNRKEAEPIVQGLINKLSELWGGTFGNSEYRFYISGRDSDLGRAVDLKFDEIYPKKVLLDEPNRQKIIDFSDLCMILKSKDYFDEQGNPKRLGLFGEVEGNKGDDLFQASYWSGKSNYCVFAFGVVDEPGSGAFISSKLVGQVNRALVTLQTNHSVVKDFRTVLWWMAHLFTYGRFSLLPPNIDEELGFFLNFIKSRFDTDIVDLIAEMGAFVHPDDVIQSSPGPSTIITKINA